MIDLRSDTLTKPTPAMLAAMTSAAVGDDVYGEDPTINELERRVAALFGKDAGLFVPSGTMSNQIAVRVHCRPQDEILLESTSHIYQWEAGGPAALSGATCRTIDGRFGLLDVPDFEGKIRPDDQHAVRTRLVCIENTHNRGGGTIYPLETVAAISRWAKSNNLAMHLDGARLWNAMVASGVSAPSGASTSTPCRFASARVRHAGRFALVGPRPARVRPASATFRWRDAASRVSRRRLPLRDGPQHRSARRGPCEREDHREGGRGRAGPDAPRPRSATNLVWFEVDAKLGTAKDVAEKLKANGVLVAALGRA